MILGGLASLAVAMLLYLVVAVPWQFALPATFMGIGHAVLFPAVLAGGSASFPGRFRGLGMTLTLGMMDLGALIGAPLIGETVHRCAAGRIAGLPDHVPGNGGAARGVGNLLCGDARAASRLTSRAAPEELRCAVRCRYFARGCAFS